MKKMNIFKSGAFVLGLAVLTSCGESFLDTKPYTSLFDENYYLNVADAEMALIGCYDALQSASGANPPFHVVAEVLSDDTYGAVGSNDDRKYQAWDRFDVTEQPDGLGGIWFSITWERYYAAVFRTNMLLQKMETIDFGGDEAIRARIEGEARFIRANLYFDMVRLWENIPLLTVPTEDNVPQAPPVDTYKLIVEDLLFAAENIPADAYPKSQGAVNDGRVTCWAAKAMLARVYMLYTGYYGADDLGVTKAEVLAGLEDIISSNEYKLATDFASLWRAASYVPNPDYNPETKENDTLDKSRYIPGGANPEVIFTHKFNNTGGSDGNGWIVMMGVRDAASSPYGQGWGACTVPQSFVDSWEPGDLRKVASIIDLVGESVTHKPESVKEYTGYLQKKYITIAYPSGRHETGGNGNFNAANDTDYIVIRYADVLLMAAELGSPDAQTYLDGVRDRAGLDPVPATPENILNERHYELAFEGIRYWDLLRQGINYAADVIATEDNVLTGGIPERYVINVDDVKKTRGFMQIPGDQISLSEGVLKQNPGW